MNFQPGRNDIDASFPGEIPSFKLIETDLSYSFLDIGPLSKGHALVIPKGMSIIPASIL